MNPRRLGARLGLALLALAGCGTTSTSTVRATALSDSPAQPNLNACSESSVVHASVCFATGVASRTGAGSPVFGVVEVGLRCAGGPSAGTVLLALDGGVVNACSGSRDSPLQLAVVGSPLGGGLEGLAQLSEVENRSAFSYGHAPILTAPFDLGEVPTSILERLSASQQVRGSHVRRPRPLTQWHVGDRLGTPERGLSVEAVAVVGASLVVRLDVAGASLLSTGGADLGELDALVERHCRGSACDAFSSDILVVTTVCAPVPARLVAAVSPEVVVLFQVDGGCAETAAAAARLREAGLRVVVAGRTERASVEIEGGEVVVDGSFGTP